MLRSAPSVTKSRINEPSAPTTLPKTPIQMAMWFGQEIQELLRKTVVSTARGNWSKDKIGSLRN